MTTQVPAPQPPLYTTRKKIAYSSNKERPPPTPSSLSIPYCVLDSSDFFLFSQIKLQLMGKQFLGINPFSAIMSLEGDP